MGRDPRYDAAIADAIAALGRVVADGGDRDRRQLLDAVMRACALRGGVHDDGRLFDKEIFHAVAVEMFERLTATLAAKLGPQVDKLISPEAGVVVDETLANNMAAMRRDLEAMLSKLPGAS